MLTLIHTGQLRREVGRQEGRRGRVNSPRDKVVVVVGDDDDDDAKTNLFSAC